MSFRHNFHANVQHGTKSPIHLNINFRSEDGVKESFWQNSSRCGDLLARAVGSPRGNAFPSLVGDTESSTHAASV